MTLFRALLILVCSAHVAGCSRTQRPLHPRSIEFQRRGAEALAQSEFDRAAGLFSLALEYEPRLPEAHNGLGLVARTRGDTLLAETLFRRALAINPNFAEAHVNLGWIQFERHNLPLAAQHFSQALAIDPGFPVARLGAGQTELSRGRLETAHWHLRKLVEVKPRDAHGHGALALVLARLGRPADAEAEAQRALDLESENALAHRARGEILMACPPAINIAEAFHRALHTDPSDVDARLGLATVLIEKGDFSAAAGELERAHESAPERVEVAFVRAYLELRHNNPMGAEKAAREALQMNADFVAAQLILAEALLRQSRKVEGRSTLVAFIRSAPNTMERQRAAAQSLLDAMDRGDNVYGR